MRRARLLRFVAEMESFAVFVSLRRVRLDPDHEAGHCGCDAENEKNGVHAAFSSRSLAILPPSA